MFKIVIIIYPAYGKRSFSSSSPGGVREAILSPLPWLGRPFFLLAGGLGTVKNMANLNVAV
jgi:hypothetical protein